MPEAQLPASARPRAVAAERAAALVAELTATTGTTTSVIAPATGDVLHELPVSSAADVRDAIARARLAQLAWARAGFAHRREVLLKAATRILDEREELLDLIQIESGKTRGQAFEEIFAASGLTRYNALSARSVLKGRTRRGGVPGVIGARIRYAPKGVVGVITPWNYALSLAAMDVVPALAAGNGVVQKADDQGALSILALREIFIDAGVPAALWAVVAGPAAEVGEALTDEVDYICFTGSTATGRRIGEKAGRRLVGASLELGGKNALIVRADVDPAEAAANTAYGCFAAMGQLCVSIERIFVDRPVSAAYTAALVERLADPKVGTSLDFANDYGSLASAAQLARVQAHLDDALAKGATVLVGGRHRPDLGPFCFEPTIVTGVTPEMSLYAEETFGAIAALYVVDGDDEAVLAANSSEYGLNAAIFSKSVRAAERLAPLLQAGSVNINDGYRAAFSSFDAPMGGQKASGVGRRNGPEGLLRFVEPVTVASMTGLMGFPRTGAEFVPLVPLMVLLGRTFAALRIK
ncbi:succinic semialdehyde dehydrogenase [Agromyces seonyuensis]|uniref:Aldehyde dehydrogenase family protein n=1 Tax=Agromyces seonyuensis TaxID=2662446 RepID=A0A6I4NZF7_9MICO|nr:succinic semialdehyde dehydrogenase [Agromyces seonyuensis]MWB99541.1 aldehyde dehydrogenase family protein [Agromyces seonyuensis]